MKINKVKSIDNIVINYETNKVNNPKKTLIFIHGFGGCMRAFDTTASYFQKKQYKIINVDLRAHGKSERPEKESQYQLDMFAKDIVTIIKKEKAKDTVLIGHCFGGILSLKLAGDYPSLIRSLVLINSSYKAPSFSHIIWKYFPLRNLVLHTLRFLPNVYIRRYPSYKKYEQSADFNLKRLASDVFHTSLKSYAYISQEIIKLDLSKKVEKVCHHTLLIHGDKDKIFPIKTAIELKKKLKNAKLETIKNANHLIVLNNQKELIEIIDRNFQQGFI